MMGWIFPDIVSIAQGFKEYGMFFMLSLGATSLLLYIASRRAVRYMTELRTVHEQVSESFKSIVDPKNPNRVITRADLKAEIEKLQEPDSRVCVRCPEIQEIKQEIFAFTSEGRKVRHETTQLFQQMADVNKRMSDGFFAIVEKWTSRVFNGSKQ